ncbi:LysR family transcriptional regulator [Paenibacillus illinoisensis]|uniref:LysR family transcriptional regulator n=1 Tax=Paenibacillus illinoisensis TaxID=59845 RepID=UPI003D2D5AEB
MDEKDWTILHMLSQEKNITKTADRMYISQPSLTYRLQQIEKEFGITLLYRGRRGVEFTEEGQLLVQYAKEMLIHLANTKERITNMDGLVKGTLRLGVARGVALYKLPKILKHFLEIYPEVNFSVSTGLNLDLISSVFKQETQIGIVRGDHHWSEEKEIIDQEPICIISEKPIDLDQLTELPRITYNTDPALIMVIDNWWNSTFKNPPSVAMNVDNMEIAKRMVQCGLGYAIVPAIVLEEHDQFEQLVIKDADGEPIQWTTWMLYRKSFLEQSTVSAFVKFVKERYSLI